MFINLRRLASIGALLLASSTFAQVTAHQGTVPAGEQQEEQRFKSPMVLDLPFVAAHSSTWGQGQVRGQERMARYICDGVSFRDFAVSVDRARGKKAKLTFHFVLANEPGIDKLASIRVALIRGDQTIHETIVPWFQVEEGRISIRGTTFVIAQDALLASPPPRLRVTLSTKDDD